MNVCSDFVVSMYTSLEFVHHLQQGFLSPCTGVTRLQGDYDPWNSAPGEVVIITPGKVLQGRGIITPGIFWVVKRPIFYTLI